MCRLLWTSPPAGTRAWLVRGPSERDLQDEWLLAKIREIHALSDGTYGRPRIHEELKEEGIHVGRKRIAPLLRLAGLPGVSRRRRFRTTPKDPAARPHEDLVNRDFKADGPDRLWVSDITFVPTWAGSLFLSVVLDAWSRKIVGWSMATHLRAELVVDALDMAVYQRKPAGVICHSDQGSQYTSLAFGKRCREAGVRPSMGSVGDAYDNALCESFFASLACELIDRRRFKTHAEARTAIFNYMEGWYSPPAATPALTTSPRWSTKGGTWSRLPEESARLSAKAGQLQCSFSSSRVLGGTTTTIPGRRVADALLSLGLGPVTPHYGSQPTLT